MHCFPHGVRACSFVPTVCMPNAGSGTLISASRALLIGSDSWVMGDQETSCISIHLRGRPVALVVDALTASWKGLDGAQETKQLSIKRVVRAERLRLALKA